MQLFITTVQVRIFSVAYHRACHAKKTHFLGSATPEHKTVKRTRGGRVWKMQSVHKLLNSYAMLAKEPENAWTDLLALEDLCATCSLN